MPSLSLNQTTKIRTVLLEARAGRSTLTELGAAHDLAASAGLADCAAELREHIRTKIGPGSTKPVGRPVGREVVLGLATGALTHYMLKGL
jgi:hypothetical protein